MAVADVNEITDETLMMQFQGGDRRAFATLVGRHKSPVYNFILRQVRTKATAEDLTQDVFVRVVQSAATFKHEARFTTWVYSIARNICIDHVRKMSLRRHPSLEQPIGKDRDPPGTPLGDRIADDHPSASAERCVVSADIAERVTVAVEQLPPEQREVFLLRQLAKIPFKDIAKMTGVPENTVKSRMRYALERLQEALSEYEEYARALR
jgi:RNA polymerase sigma-70 factor (ECF subfamily)